jgi:hypothetical protein
MNINDFADTDHTTFSAAVWGAKDSGIQGFDACEYDATLIELAENHKIYVAMDAELELARHANELANRALRTPELQIRQTEIVQQEKCGLMGTSIVPKAITSLRERIDEVRVRKLDFYDALSFACFFTKRAAQNPEAVPIASAKKIMNVAKLARELRAQVNDSGVQFSNAFQQICVWGALDALSKLTPSTPMPIPSRDSARRSEIEFVLRLGRYFYDKYGEYFPSRITQLSVLAIVGGIGERQVLRDLEFLREYDASGDKFSLKPLPNLS